MKRIEMEKSKLKAAVSKLIDALPSDPEEQLVVLAHVTAAALQRAKMTPVEVAGYCMSMTRMLDGQFDRK